MRQLMEVQSRIYDENEALRRFVAILGFNPDAVIRELQNGANQVCKVEALTGLKVERDFSRTGFTEAGVEMANRWLDGISQK